MRVLLVLAHPDPASFNAAIAGPARETPAGLEQAAGLLAAVFPAG